MNAHILREPGFWVVLITAATLLGHRAYFDEAQMVNAWIVKSNDTHEHLGATDSLVDSGMYSLDGEHAFAARMPGYAFPYVLLRAVFDQATARSGLIIIQLLVYLLAVWLTFIWLSERYGPTMAFSGVAKLVVFNYVTHVHFRLLPVSFAISLVLILLYLHHRMLRSESMRAQQVLLFGALLAWLIFLRPFFLPIALLWPVVILWQRGRWSLKWIVVFFVPFAVIEGAWVGRNFATLGRFIPLQTTFTENDDDDYYRATATKQSVVQLRPFIIGFGGDNVWYFPGSAMDWFLSSDDLRTPMEVFPQQVFNAGITPQELVTTKELIVESYRTYSPDLEADITQRAIDFTQRLRASSWLSFYVTGRAKALAKMVASNVTQDWPMAPFAKTSAMGKLYRLLCVAMWALVFAGGLLLAIPRLFRRKSFELALLVLGMTLIFVHIVEFLHYQYFVFAWMGAFFIWMEALSKSTLLQKWTNRSMNFLVGRR